MSQLDQMLGAPEAIDGTGSAGLDPGARFVVTDHGPFKIKLQISADGKFLRVAEVALKTDFRSSPQRVRTTGYLDVDEFYRE
jgi:hypothetical protein